MKSDDNGSFRAAYDKIYMPGSLVMTGLRVPASPEDPYNLNRIIPAEGK